MTDYQQILVGIDFTESTDKLIEKAVRISGIFDAKITLVHIIDYLPPTYVAAELPSGLVSEDVLVDRAKQRIADLMKRYSDIKYETHIALGRRKQSIVAIANKIDADLAILGKRDPVAIDRFLGSTTLGVINRSDLDVLVVRL